jgi:hypothetical protein
MKFLTMPPLQKHVFLKECKQWLQQVTMLLFLTWFLCIVMLIAMQSILETTFSSIPWLAFLFSFAFLLFPAQMMMPLPKTDEELEEWKQEHPFE